MFKWTKLREETGNVFKSSGCGNCPLMTVKSLQYRMFFLFDLLLWCLTKACPGPNAPTPTSCCEGHLTNTLLCKTLAKISAVSLLFFHRSGTWWQCKSGFFSRRFTLKNTEKERKGLMLFIFTPFFRLFTFFLLCTLVTHHPPCPPPPRPFAALNWLSDIDSVGVCFVSRQQKGREQWREARIKWSVGGGGG